MLGPDGRPLEGRGWYDAEALADDGGVVYVGIERVNQIVRFDYRQGWLGRARPPVAVPPGMKLLPHNKSIECLEMAPKGGPLAGTLISISERGLDTDGNLMGFLIGGAGGVFSLKRTDDFDVSDCAVDAGRQAAGAGAPLLMGCAGLAMRIRSVPLRR